MAEDTQVIIVGAGPVGLLLAGELRLGGARVVVVESRVTPTTESRASTLHARTMELFDSRGLLAALGDPPRDHRGHFGGIPLDLGQPSRHSGQWKVPQARTEQVLQEWAVSLGAQVRRGATLTGVHDDGAAVHATIRTARGRSVLRAPYLVACDGEDSTVRRLTGAEFPGRPAHRELLRADVAGVEIPDRRFERLAPGLAIAARRPDGVTRVMVHEFGRPAGQRTGPPGFGEVVDAWKRVTGEDLSGGTPLWVNAFGDANRQLRHYRHGRILFAGDAAHQQMPAGGQALNLGLQDAANLGWKLALEVGARPPAGLLDSYHRERHQVGARVLANIRAQALLLLGDEEVDSVRVLLGELLAEEGNRDRLAAMISGLDVRYPQEDGDDPRLGRRMPELTWQTPDGPVGTAALLRAGRGVLLDRCGRPGGPMSRIGRPWADRVDTVTARPAGDAEFEDHTAVLIRPDGYVAWIGADVHGAEEALRRWFGAATPEG
ncbi:FAD-dependent monooxygenase [Amorphoplanes digitatis]|nr:FAD-dependent monooxygenase [Actinoplanes digitatis]GID94071.1 putative oxygenase [Actinoplanes digitatis]